MVHPFQKRRRERLQTPADFTTAIDHVMKRDRVGRLRAMSRARQEYGHLLEGYQQRGIEKQADRQAALHTDPSPGTHPDIVKFEDAVTAYQNERACNRLIALTRVASARPDLLAAYRRAQLG